MHDVKVLFRIACDHSLHGAGVLPHLGQIERAPSDKILKPVAILLEHGREAGDKMPSHFGEEFRYRRFADWVGRQCLWPRL